VMMCTMDAVECRSYGDVNFEFWNGTLFDESDYVAKKSLLLFFFFFWHANCKEYGIHLSVNKVANMNDVKECSHCAVFVSRASPFCSSCIHV
jgi:hypothetical protein